MDSLAFRRLAARAQGTLGLTHQELATLTGSSLRTVQRWAANQSQPASFHMERLVPAVHARDPALAAEIARALGLSLERLGVASDGARSSPPPEDLVPLLADASVAAAADVVQLPPNLVRPALSAAVRVALQAGLELATLAAALEAPAPAKPATPASNGARGSRR